MKEVNALSKKHNLLVHLDGARIFNAAVALKVDVKELTCYADSVSFCLSKGLSAPVGSVICGAKWFVAEARRSRKVLGGGMRQCGIIAAAGITALDEMVDRIADDHKNAQHLAQGIARISGLSIEPERVQTNIVYFDLVNQKIKAEELVIELGNKGIKILKLGPSRFRAVTHYGISSEDIDCTLTALYEIMNKS
jgi:threonine aldolase